MLLNALVLNKNDNVATAVKPLERGASISVTAGDSVVNVTLSQSIPFGHKFALEDIGCGREIIKYGETIGQATAGIKKGEHVHVHNVEGLRGRGDKP